MEILTTEGATSSEARDQGDHAVVNTGMAGPTGRSTATGKRMDSRLSQATAPVFSTPTRIAVVIIVYSFLATLVHQFIGLANNTTASYAEINRNKSIKI